MEGTNLGIEDAVAVAAPIVTLDYVFESGDAAIVHVGRGAGDLTQRRRFEVALARARIAEFAVAPRYAGIVQAFIGEVGTDMTGDAVRFATEKL